MILCKSFPNLDQIMGIKNLIILYEPRVSNLARYMTGFLEHYMLKAKINSNLAHKLKKDF